MLIKDYIDGLPFTTTHDDFDEYNMHVLAAPTCNYYERHYKKRHIRDILGRTKFFSIIHMTLL